MDIFKAFATDPNLEDNGRWHRIGGTDDAPCKLLLGRVGTRKYNAVMALQYEANKTLLEGKDKPAANVKVDQMVHHALASCVLLGWANLEYKGVNMVYSYATAHQMLEHRDFREMVQAEASRFQAYKLDQDEADAKNLLPA